MNPSAPDWIPKFLNRFGEQKLIYDFPDTLSFYTELRRTGFLYGVAVKTVLNEKVSDLNLTKDELTKVNLFHALFFSYYLNGEKATADGAYKSIIEFYKDVGKGKTSFLQKLVLTNSTSSSLEKMLSARLQESNSALKKNSSTIIAYSLLYADVLAYNWWLSYPEDIKSYAEELESRVINCCFLALKSKEKKNEYDELLIELFESSSEYLLVDGNYTDDFALPSLTNISGRNFLEKKYLLDICTIAVWDDHKMDQSEYGFLMDLAMNLGLEETEVQDSLNALREFSEAHTSEIKLFEHSNPVKLFYKQSAATVNLLVKRNKKRLIKELEESGELLLLLSQSSVRDLTKEEKKKVKIQLLDIFKTIPSLTIFLLPGGAILLPLFVKLIPKLLPSAFNENRIEKSKGSSG